MIRKRNSAEETVLPLAWLPVLQAKIRPPVCVALGSPRQTIALIEEIGLEQPVLYQMDLHQSERIGRLLGERQLKATLVHQADLWDLPEKFQTVIFPAEPRGERMLKLDMVEQAYHILAPHGTLIVLSRRDNEQFFPATLKKIYGKVHAPATGEVALLWCQRTEDRPRRRHEMTFQVSAGEGESFRFLSRPGVFSYGRFDNGARALVEIAVINPGDRILDLGCGCGTNGIICGRRGGPTSHVTFVDSNCRAAALAELNARTNGLTEFDVRTSPHLHDLPVGSFDVVLTNPPYFANLDIAQRFIEQSRPLTKVGGRFYLVTKQPSEVAPMVAECFDLIEAVEHRGYVVLCATASK